MKVGETRFEIVDIITGTSVSGTEYCITTESAIMEVLWVREESMKVKILSHETRPHWIGSLYTVDPIWFKLARPRTNFYRGEKED